MFILVTRLMVKFISSRTLGIQAVGLLMFMEFWNSNYHVNVTTLENQCT